MTIAHYVLCYDLKSKYLNDSLEILESGRDLRPPSVNELVSRAKSGYRQNKIVGGSAMDYGEAPWTVSIKHRDGR